MKKAMVSWTLLLLCNVMWSMQFTCIKLTQAQVGPYFTVWGPMLFSTFLLIPFVVKDYKKGGRKLSDVLVFVQLAALGAFPAQVCMTYGTQYSLASNAAVITLSLPVITTFFAFVILKEKMNTVRWISFAVAIAGVILCSMSDFENMNFSSKYTLGNALIFIAIFSNAYYNVGCKKIADRYSEMEMVFYTYIIMVIMLSPLVFYYERDVFAKIHAFTFQTWTGLTLLTLFHNFLSMVLFFKALKFLDAIQVALSNYLITFIGLPFAAIWLGEKLSTPVILGGSLVLFATLAVTILDYKLNYSRTVKIAPENA